MENALWATFGLQVPSWPFLQEEASKEPDSPAQCLGARALQPECGVQTPALLPTGCASSANLLNLSAPKFPHLSTGNRYNSTCLVMLLEGLNELEYAECLVSMH